MNGTVKGRVTAIGNTTVITLDPDSMAEAGFGEGASGFMSVRITDPEKAQEIQVGQAVEVAISESDEPEADPAAAVRGNEADKTSHRTPARTTRARGNVVDTAQGDSPRAP